MDDYLKRLGNVPKKRARSLEAFDPVPWLAPQVHCAPRSIDPVPWLAPQAHCAPRSIDPVPWLAPQAHRAPRSIDREQQYGYWPPSLPDMISRKKSSPRQVIEKKVGVRGAAAICEVLEIEDSSVFQTHFTAYAEVHKVRIREHVASFRKQEAFDPGAKYSHTFLEQIILAVLRRAGLEARPRSEKVKAFVTTDRRLYLGIVSMIHTADRRWQKADTKKMILPPKKMPTAIQSASTNVSDDDDDDAGAVLLRNPLLKPVPTYMQSREKQEHLVHGTYIPNDLRAAAASLGLALRTSTKKRRTYPQANLPCAPDIQAAAEAAAHCGGPLFEVSPIAQGPPFKPTVICCDDDDDDDDDDASSSASSSSSSVS